MSTYALSAQQNESADLAKDKAAVKSVVEEFLKVIGNNDVDAIPDLFYENANIGGASLRNGLWTTFTMTFEEFLERLKSDKEAKKFTEPVSKYTIHITEGKLAFVKADATLIINGVAKFNNFDYFTLMKENGNWKILNGSYVSIPIEE